MKQSKLLIFISCLCLSFIAQAQTISLQELVNHKQYEAVLSKVAELTPADSTDFQTMNAIAQAYEGVLKHRDAYTCYQHCLTLDSTHIDLLNALARTATNLGKASDAERYFRKVLANDSTNFYANYQLGRLYYQLGNYQKAIDQYEYLLERDEQNPTLLRNVGDSYMKAEEVAPALAAYYLAFEHNKENAGLGSTLINLLLRLGGEQAVEALAVCDTALRYNPTNRILRQNKGMALYLNKKYSEADTLYTQLLAEGDSSYLTIKYGGTSRYYAGHTLRGIELLELAYKLDTTSVDVCLILGSSLGRTYDRKTAHKLFDKADENMQPKEYLVNQLLQFRGETFQRDGRYNEAARLYYELWKRTEKLVYLSNICNLYSPFSVSQYRDDDARKRGLYINMLYLKEHLAKGEDTKHLFFKRNLLESYLEDMFFRNIKEETIIAPDGKKSKITADEIREMASKLPEMPEDVRRQIEQQRKASEQRKKELEQRQKEREKQQAS